MDARAFLKDGMRFIFANSVPVLVKRFASSISGAGYDDEVTWALTGSEYVSGLVFPIKTNQGSAEAMLMEQGKLLTKDKTLFLNGSVNLNSSGLLFGIGADYYSLIPIGVSTFDTPNGSTIYSKCFIRYSIPGSLF